MLAHAAGVTLGPITAISESTSYQPEMKVMGMVSRATIATPVAAGTQNLTANVTIVWEIR